MGAFLNIKINNWEKHQLARKDVKVRFWLKLHHDIMYDTKIRELSSEEFRVWVFLLCERSRADTEWFRVYPTPASVVSCVCEPGVVSSIKKLKQIRMVEVKNSTMRYVNVTPDKIRLEEIRLDKNIYAQNDLSERESVDLEIYKNYPRKVGKAKGLQKLRRDLKNGRTIEEMQTALKAFRSFHGSARTEPTYLPHFSTWASSWTDWLEVNAGSSESIRPAPPTPRPTAPEIPEEDFTLPDEDSLKIIKGLTGSLFKKMPTTKETT